MKLLEMNYNDETYYINTAHIVTVGSRNDKAPGQGTSITVVDRDCFLNTDRPIEEVLKQIRTTGSIDRARALEIARKCVNAISDGWGEKEDTTCARLIANVLLRELDTP